MAADIAGVASTHINHLTPRVLDIDELYRRMTARGVTMIDAIQGPPCTDGPAVLLRQTSFRALAEPRRFRLADGTIRKGTLRVRFGEVEARGVALTPKGRQRYDAAMAAADPAQVWLDYFPSTDAEMAAQGLAYYRGGDPSKPVVYEDFLPASAAGIFRSNLDSDAEAAQVADDSQYSVEWLAGAIDRAIYDPYALYEAHAQEGPHDPAEHRAITRPGAPGTRCYRRRYLARRAGRTRAAGAHTGDRRGAIHRGGNHAHPRRSCDRCCSTSLFDVARHTGAGARRIGGPIGSTTFRAQIRPCHAGHRRGRQDHLRGAGRGAGDDRHLPVRRRLVPSAVRPHHRLRAAGHRLMETWHPLGVVGVITAFNFPVAVWAWNTAVALVCGDAVVWKPSELTPVTALACQALIAQAAAAVGAPPR
ncbi:aldehyde dehydrogenase family protein [Mycobacterium xenopi 3993]|nr:aldehyde dehydrogenase family protein [Mycobacterium xenopi 3993]